MRRGKVNDDKGNGHPELHHVAIEICREMAQAREFPDPGFPGSVASSFVGQHCHLRWRKR